MRAIGSALTIALIAALTTTMVAAMPSSRVSAEWKATLTGKDGRKVSGAASATLAADGASTVVTIALDGDTPGATRPWHIHSGSCTKSGGVVGGARAYTPLTIDGAGHTNGKATLTPALADTGSYYVNVHDASTAMNIIVACGDLQKR